MDNFDNINNQNEQRKPIRYDGMTGEPIYADEALPQNPPQQAYYTEPVNMNSGSEWTNVVEPKKPNTALRIILFVAFIVIAVIIISVSALVSYFINNKVDTDEKPDYNEYFTDLESDIDVEHDTHFSPEFNGYSSITLNQVSKVGKTKLTHTEIYNKCIMSTVMIYSYKYNQIDTPSASGTGTIITEDGFIVTNQHVVSGFTNFTVMMMDGREYEATLVGEDEKTDLAVIKVDASGLTACELGYVSEAVIGEEVSAIGNPSGLIGTITTGIVSSLGRTISTLDPYTINHIQFDAPVSSGNSGGPLVNEYGQVIGIVDSKYVVNYAEGLGFAISIDEAIPIICDIIKNGEVTGRVRLGITYTTVSEERAKLTGKKPGLYIESVNEDLPVGKCGLKIGDIITEINGFDVSEQEEFRKAVREMSVGDTITMKVIRKDKSLTFTTTVGEYND